MEILSTDSQEVVLGCNTLFWDLIVVVSDGLNHFSK